jgi:hypothetical protein
LITRDIGRTQVKNTDIVFQESLCHSYRLFYGKCFWDLLLDLVGGAFSGSHPMHHVGSVLSHSLADVNLVMGRKSLPKVWGGAKSLLEMA